MFIIRGQLLAVGTEQDSILFTAETPAVGWHSLRFMDTESTGQPVSEVRYCRLEHGRAIGTCPDNSGGAICFSHANGVVANCLIVNNWSSSIVGGGGGIYCEFSDPLIADNTIAYNWTDHDGGGIYCKWSTPQILRNRIEYNTGNRGAGIACFEYSSAEIRENRIADNIGEGLYLSGSAAAVVNNIVADNGGPGIHSYLCNAQIINNLICGNSAYRGAGIYNEGSSPVIVNSSIVDNLSQGEGGGIYNTFVVVGMIFGSNPSVTNGIVYGNTGSMGAQIYSGVQCSAALRYTNVQDLESGGVEGTVYLIEGNMDEVPGFVGAGDHPYCPDEGSPCIDAGTPDPSALNLPEFDLAGNPRIANDRVDLGAYEYTEGSAVPAGSASAGIHLAQNFPNPFNPSTRIAFSLESSQALSLEIVDAAGRCIAVLYSGHLPAGSHELSWNGRDAAGRPQASGVYFAVLHGEAGSQARAMTLIK
jgi:hypothetical protein